MIVTTVRSSDASERELEALAIFMGHSLQVQRYIFARQNTALNSTQLSTLHVRHFTENCRFPPATPEPRFMFRSSDTAGATFSCLVRRS